MICGKCLEEHLDRKKRNLSAKQTASNWGDDKQMSEQMSSTKTKTVQLRSKNKLISRPYLLVKSDKETQFEKNHKNLKNNQVIFKNEPVREKLKRKKVGLNSEEIKFEESKLVAKSYQRIEICELLLRRLLIGGIYRFYSDLSSDGTVSEKEIENGLNERVKDRT